jgi:hypothetical protein
MTFASQRMFEGYPADLSRSQCGKYVDCMKLGSGQKAVGTRGNATVLPETVEFKPMGKVEILPKNWGFPLARLERPGGV